MFLEHIGQDCDMLAVLNLVQERAGPDFTITEVVFEDMEAEQQPEEFWLTNGECVISFSNKNLCVSTEEIRDYATPGVPLVVLVKGNRTISIPLPYLLANPTWGFDDTWTIWQNARPEYNTEEKASLFNHCGYNMFTRHRGCQRPYLIELRQDGPAVLPPIGYKNQAPVSAT